jgi:hypothetical protein
MDLNVSFQVRKAMNVKTVFFSAMWNTVSYRNVPKFQRLCSFHLFCWWWQEPLNYRYSTAWTHWFIWLRIGSKGMLLFWTRRWIWITWKAESYFIERRTTFGKYFLKAFSWLQLEKLKAVATFAYQLHWVCVSCRLWLSGSGFGIRGWLMGD